jgi:ParB family transcriptional regulator, chromosome partitioning protein
MSMSRRRLLPVADSPDRRRLGRGLASLLGDQAAAIVADETLRSLATDEVHPNPHQPRQRIDDDALNALAASIQRHGVVQPIVVRPREAGGYELIAGERRWRAAGRAGLGQIPAIVRDADLGDRLELALVENMLREDLSPIEVAQACATLIEDFGQTHQDIATRLGRSRPAVSNLIRLLELPEEIQDMIDRGELSEGHGRAILMADGPRARRLLAERVRRDGLTVRQTEQLARHSGQQARPAASRQPLSVADDAIDAFTAAFDAPVRVRASARGDVVVELRFSSEQALRAALARLGAVAR